MKPVTRVVAAAVVAVAATASFTSCAASAPAASTQSSAANSSAVDLSGVCPATVVVQTDWNPEAEHGALYQMVGANPKIDASKKTVTGDLVAGATTFIEALNEAAEDTNVAAIVVRVDSGGGDGLASDLMYRAVLEAKKKKPVIASMGDVAASSGYYVAMGADEIVASPTTLTGSIGAFFAKPAIKKLAEDFGATQISIQRGKLAGITDTFDPCTPDQRKAAQKWIDDFYDSFITEVAASR